MAKQEEEPAHVCDAQGSITTEVAESSKERITWTIVHCSVCGEGVRRSISNRESI